jgi:hypothetical protein
MSFGGPPPNALPPSGPFEAHLTAVASSPYTIGIAIFLLNTCGRFLPFEVSKEQEKFLNQPIIRRLLIFVIFFIATRNIVIAGLMSIIVIICIAYLFNENSDYYLLGKSKALSSSSAQTKVVAQANAPSTGPTVTSSAPGTPVGLSMEEQMILKSLSDKAEKFRASQAADMIGTNSGTGAKLHQQYQKIIESLSFN